MTASDDGSSGVDRADVVVLLHELDTFDDSTYFLRYIVDVWRKDGLRVTVLHGPGASVDARLAILHVDLTIVPEDYLRFVRSYPTVINGRVTDISKRTISANLVNRDDAFDGPVIVKTDLNCGGVREATLEMRGPFLRKFLSASRRILPWSFRSHLRPSAYPVLESKSEVPRAAWNNPHLVVERFLPEQRDGYYCLRTWVFLGASETHSICYSKNPVVKSTNVIRREVLSDVPDELRRIRTDLGFDFGKFDYGIVDDRVILYDVNRTPTYGDFEKTRFLPNFQRLAEGIQGFL
ncbi:MAG TPA: hypothetical protein VIL33_07585 [Rhodothermia bacterium]